jgi:hypothetical protein
VPELYQRRRRVCHASTSDFDDEDAFHPRSRATPARRRAPTSPPGSRVRLVTREERII